MSAVHALLATMMVGVSTANAIRGSPKPAQKIGGIRYKGRVQDDEIATTTTTTTTTTTMVMMVFFLSSEQCKAQH